jgi:hypothetical protein
MDWSIGVCANVVRKLAAEGEGFSRCRPVFRVYLLHEVRDGREAALPPPTLLLVLESCFLDGIECFELLQSVPIAVLLEWEVVSAILKEGLAAVQWWDNDILPNYIPREYFPVVLRVRLWTG